MSLYSRLDRLAADVAKLDRKVDSVSNAPQAQRTSIEAGTMDVNDEDGNLVSTIGLQEDGSGATRFFDGPIPPVPAGFTALADGPLIQGTWDGSFVDGQQATYDLAYLEVAATLVDDDSRVSFATITAKEGASATLVANQSGQWAVAVRSVSQAGKKSEFFSAGTVEVKLVDLAGAIEAVQDSANGKNKVTYSSHAPTPDDPGIFDDTWFVGQVGRPEDIIEATNLALNPRFANGLAPQTPNSYAEILTGGGGIATIVDGWLKLEKGNGNYPTAYVIDTRYAEASRWQGKTFTVSATLRLDAPTQGSVSGDERRLDFGYVQNGTYNYAKGSSGQAPNAPGEYRLSVVCNVPVDASAWFVRFMGDVSTTAATPTYWADVVLEEGATPSEFFDGDTPSGTTDNESHYRWTGTPHASTSEKYLPALDIGASDNWNVIEQYRHDGTGWVKVELSHYVFSTVDLGKATVGELDGIRIKAETIAGRSLEAEALNFKAARGLLLESPVIRVGNAVEITEDYGIRQFGPDGALNISLPSDGSPASFAGDVRAKSLTATGRMAIEGPAVVASGGQLQLESGVTPPATPPNVSSYVKRTQFPPLSETENAVGLAFDGTYFWRAVDNSVTGAQDRMERIDAAGNLVSSFDHYFWVRNGITVIGSEIFALGIEEDELRDKSKRFIYVYDFEGTLKRKWEYAAYGSGTYQPAIGTDGTYVFVAQCWATGEVSWRKYDRNTGIGQGRYDSAGKIHTDIVSFDIGNFDYGTPTAVLTTARETGGVDLYHPTTGARTDYAGWYSGDKEQVRATVWANGRFHHLSTSGNLVTMSTTKYPNGTVGPDTNDWWAVYTWRNGANETTISAARQFTWMRRGGIKLSPGQMPTGVSSVRVYVARKSTEPVSTDYKMVATTVADGSLVVQDLGTPSGNPPASNSFPNSAPGIIRSALGNIEFRGDGSGRIGPLTFAADGTMSSSAVPDWIPVTTFASGYGPQTWGFAPAYRVWPDGKVEWRGVVAMTGTPPTSNDMTAGTADVLTIPAEARPAQPVNVPAASTSGINLRRIEFGPAAASTVLRFYNGGQTGKWVSLESIYYYKE